jgi:soluble lytic murein transglycosylase-like protein
MRLAARISEQLGQAWPHLREEPVFLDQLGEIAARTDGADLIESLVQITVDLDGYLAVRAQELAQPLIDKAQADAAERVKDAEGEMERKDDLIAEFRRQMKFLLRSRGQYVRAWKLTGEWRGRDDLEPQTRELLLAVTAALNSREDKA